MKIAERLGLEGLEKARTGEELAIQCRLIEGSRAQISEGAARLAAWLLDPETPRSEKRTLFAALSDSLVRRALADAVELAESDAAVVAQVTGGQVLPEHWAQQRGGWTRDEVRRPVPAAEPWRAEVRLHAEVRGRIGEVQAGPIFTAIDDPFAPNEFVLSGCGLALRLDAARAQAMRGALEAGLAGLAGR